MTNVRDIAADYRAARMADYENCLRTGNKDRAAMLAELLGLTVEKAPVGAKERAVNDAPLETAVEADAPKRRGRPKKVAE